MAAPATTKPTAQAEPDPRNVRAVAQHYYDQHYAGEASSRPAQVWTVEDARAALAAASTTR